MTVIAWDGHSLAGDKLSNFAGLRTPTRKVYRIRKPDGAVVLAGAAGHTGQCQAYMRWARNPKLPEPTLNDIEILLIDERGRCWLAENGLQWALVRSRCFAIGSGAGVALGAMAAGASAKEAVVVTNRLVMSCGFGVDVVRR